jgi:hypothetical protein
MLQKGPKAATSEQSEDKTQSAGEPAAWLEMQRSRNVQESREAAHRAVKPYPPNHPSAFGARAKKIIQRQSKNGG